jgi:hypothetical protein
MLKIGFKAMIIFLIHMRSYSVKGVCTKLYKYLIIKLVIVITKMYQAIFNITIFV